MTDNYYADVYLKDCGELTKVKTEVDLDSDPVLGKITVWFVKPEEGE